MSQKPDQEAPCTDPKKEEPGDVMLLPVDATVLQWCVTVGSERTW